VVGAITMLVLWWCMYVAILPEVLRQRKLSPMHWSTMLEYAIGPVGALALAVGYLRGDDWTTRYAVMGVVLSCALVPIAVDSLLIADKSRRHAVISFHAVMYSWLLGFLPGALRMVDMSVGTGLALIWFAVIGALCLSFRLLGGRWSFISALAGSYLLFSGIALVVGHASFPIDLIFAILIAVLLGRQWMQADVAFTPFKGEIDVVSLGCWGHPEVMAEWLAEKECGERVDVVLTDAGGFKSELMRSLREVYGFTLPEVAALRRAVLPKTIQEDTTCKDGKLVKEILERHGAKVSLVSVGGKSC